MEFYVKKAYEGRSINKQILLKAKKVSLNINFVRETPTV